MKHGIAFRKTLLRLLISSLVLAVICSLLFAREKAQPDTSRKLSVGLLIDTSAHQKKVIEFEREVVHSIAEGFASVGTQGFAIRYADEVETLQDWSPLDTGVGSASTRIELDTGVGRTDELGLPTLVLRQDSVGWLERSSTLPGITNCPFLHDAMTGLPVVALSVLLLFSADRNI